MPGRWPASGRWTSCSELVARRRLPTWRAEPRVGSLRGALRSQSGLRRGPVPGAAAPICGVDVRGLVALDARTPSPWPSLFPAAELHVAAPLVPSHALQSARQARGASWARVARGLGLAAELAARSWRHLLDSEHHDLPATHSWDLTELLRRYFVEGKALVAPLVAPNWRQRSNKCQQASAANSGFTSRTCSFFV
ncbi:unnamed protein product [Effrenium voratum]|nr:unnamed protein product [Effrenium voratum]